MTLKVTRSKINGQKSNYVKGWCFPRYDLGDFDGLDAPKVTRSEINEQKSNYVKGQCCPKYDPSNFDNLDAPK